MYHFSSETRIKVVYRTLVCMGCHRTFRRLVGRVVEDTNCVREAALRRSHRCAVIRQVASHIVRETPHAPRMASKYPFASFCNCWHSFSYLRTRLRKGY